jgi:toxin YoeB
VKNISFTPSAFSEYNQWLNEDKKAAAKILELLRNISLDPFKGEGKPEPLKGNFKGFWSRRINKEHRLIYKCDDTTIYVVKCRGHYD